MRGVPEILCFDNFDRKRLCNFMLKNNQNLTEIIFSLRISIEAGDYVVPEK